MSPCVLANHGVELVKLVCGLIASKAADADTLRQRCDHLLGEYVAKCQRSGAAADSIDAAKYAFVALIDERILSSDLPLREAWLSNPLQMRHYESFAAGEEFYTRLEKFRHPQSDAIADVLEVYHLCLTLGFKGRLADDRGLERRKLLIEQITGEVLSARGASASEISPRWQTQGTPPEAKPIGSYHGVPVWLIPIALGLLVLIAAVSMNLLVNSRIDAFVRDFPAR